MAWAAMAPLAVITGPPTQDTKFTEAGGGHLRAADASCGLSVEIPTDDLFGTHFDGLGV